MIKPQLSSLVIKVTDVGVHALADFCEPTDLCVLLDEHCEVVEQAVLWTQEIELIVSLLSIHQIREKTAAVSGHKLSCQLDHVSGNDQHGQS